MGDDYLCAACGTGFDTAGDRNRHRTEVHSQGAKTSVPSAGAAEATGVAALPYSVLTMGEAAEFDRHWPLHPRLQPSGAPILLDGETVLAEWQPGALEAESRQAKKGTEFRRIVKFTKARVEATLTDRRVVLVVRDWYREQGLQGRFLAAVDNDARNAFFAGHIPLEAVRTLRWGEHAVLKFCETTFLHRNASRTSWFRVGVELSAGQTNPFARQVIDATQARWASRELSGPCREALDRATVETIRERAILKKIDTYKYVVPFGRIVGTGEAVADTDAGVATGDLPPVEPLPFG